MSEETRVFRPSERYEVIEEIPVNEYVAILSRFKTYLFRVEASGVLVQYVPFITARLIWSTNAAIMFLLLSGLFWAFGDTTVAVLVLANLVPFAVVLTITMWFWGPQFRKIKVPADYENYARNAIHRGEPKVRQIKVNVYQNTVAGIISETRKEQALQLPKEVAGKVREHFRWVQETSPVPVPMTMDTISEEEFLGVQKDLTRNPLG